MPHRRRLSAQAQSLEVLSDLPRAAEMTSATYAELLSGLGSWLLEVRSAQVTQAEAATNTAASHKIARQRLGRRQAVRYQGSETKAEPRIACKRIGWSKRRIKGSASPCRERLDSFDLEGLRAVRQGRGCPGQGPRRPATFIRLRRRAPGSHVGNQHPIDPHRATVRLRTYRTKGCLSASRRRWPWSSNYASALRENGENSMDRTKLATYKIIRVASNS